MIKLWGLYLSRRCELIWLLQRVTSNGGGGLAKMFPPALQSYLGNDSYY